MQVTKTLIHDVGFDLDCPLTLTIIFRAFKTKIDRMTSVPNLGALFIFKHSRQCWICFLSTKLCLDFDL